MADLGHETCLHHMTNVRRMNFLQTHSFILYHRLQLCIIKGVVGGGFEPVGRISLTGGQLDPPLGPFWFHFLTSNF